MFECNEYQSYNMSAPAHRPAKRARTSKDESKSAVSGPKVVRMLRTLRRQVQGEVRKASFASTVTPASSANPVIEPLSQIAQGDDISQREGLAIKTKYHLLRYNVVHNNNVQSLLSRVIVFYDTRQVPATVPTPAEVVLVPNNVRTPLNPSYSGRFKVIHDQMYWTNSLAYTMRDCKNYYNLQIPIRFTGSGPTTLCLNGLYIMYLSEGGAGDTASLTYMSTLGFYDN